MACMLQPVSVICYRISLFCAVYLCLGLVLQSSTSDSLHQR